MKVKIKKIGNSQGVVVPANYLKELGVEAGQELHIHYDSRLKCITLSKEENVTDDLFKREVLAIVKEYIDNKDVTL